MLTAREVLATELHGTLDSFNISGIEILSTSISMSIKIGELVRAEL